MSNKVESTQDTDTTLKVREFDYIKRDCGSCNECCKGYLYGDAHGVPFYPDNPCHYLDMKSPCGGCTIYNDRPAVCRDFKCWWLMSQQVPNWMKPELSKVIIYTREFNDVEGQYLEEGETIQWISMVECGQKVDSIVLSWVIQQAQRTQSNLHYQVNKQDHYLGSAQFHQFVNDSSGFQFKQDEN